MRSVIAGVMLLAGAATVPAGERDWKVGLAQMKITPEQPLVMSGYGGRSKPFAKVEADLYVKAMVLEDAAGQRGVIVTSDLLGFTAAVAEPICARLEKSLGLPRSAILLNSSHTHAGPALGLSGKEGDALRTVEYTRQLQDRVVATVEAAAKEVKPATLSMGSGVVHFVMNRREFTPKGVILGVNPRGLADRTVPVLCVNNPDGSVRGI